MFQRSDWIPKLSKRTKFNLSVLRRANLSLTYQTAEVAFEVGFHTRTLNKVKYSYRDIETKKEKF